MTIRTLAVVALLGVCAGAATAQNTGAILTDNGAVYRLGGTTGALATSATATAPPTVDLFKPGATLDNVFNDWWWFRTGADTREFQIANATSRVLSGSNQVTYGYNLTSGLTGQLSYTLTGFPGGARVDQRWSIFNPGNNAVQVNMFHYVDFDLSGAAGAHTAALTTPNQRMEVFHAPSGKGADWWGVGASAYQVTSFATLRGLLTNTAINDLNNTGLPFGPGDFTGAYQWTFNVGAGGSVHFLSSYALNGSAIPAPGAAALLGIAGLAGLRRRR